MPDAARPDRSPEDENLRVFTSFPLLTFFAKDEQEAARMLYALDEAINALPGTSTELDEECYERVSDEHPDEPWHPVIPDGEVTPAASAVPGDGPAIAQSLDPESVRLCLCQHAESQHVWNSVALADGRGPFSTAACSVEDCYCEDYVDEEAAEALAEGLS